MGLKVNLLFEKTQILSDHLNLIQLLDDETDNEKRCDIRQIDTHVDNGEADEIVAIGVLTHFPIEIIPNMIDNWLGKLAVGGRLIIGDIDIFLLANKYIDGVVDDSAMNNILYGNISNPLSIKRSIFNSFILANFLKSKGLKILQHRVDGYNITIEAQRIG